MQKYYFDLHTHSKYSYDGALEPKQIIKTAKKQGLSGVAITDHNTIKGGSKAKRYESPNFKVIVGAEIKTEKGEILGLFLSEEIASRRSHEVMEAIRSQDGIVVLPHPFDQFRLGSFPPKEANLELLDCIEVFNARCVFQQYNQKAHRFAEEHRLGITAGSDGHLKSEIGNAGVKTSERNIKKALKEKNVEVFGQVSSPITHIRTKIVKWKKKLK